MASTSVRSLATPKVFDTCRIQLTSPLIRIGSDVSQLSPYEYVQTDRHVYQPHTDLLARALRQLNLLDDYIQAIKKRKSITDLLIQAFGNDWPHATDDQGRSLFPEIRRSEKIPPGLKVSDLRPMVRNGMGQLYIPGSSIKGAIRTAIAYELLSRADHYGVLEKQRVSSIEKELRQKIDQGDLNNRRRQKTTDDALFMNELFNNYGLSYDGRSVRARQGPNTDILRVLQISDSEPILPIISEDGVFNQAAVVEVLVSSHFPSDSNDQYPAKYRASLYAEVVRNVKTEVNLSLDTQMLTWFQHRNDMKLPFKDVADIVQICQRFAQAQWDGESNYWQSIQNQEHEERSLKFDQIREFYAAQDCPWTLRLGWATGMTGTTIGWLLSDDLRADLRDACGIPARGFPAPKSRRTILDAEGNACWPPGWVKFECHS